MSHPENARSPPSPRRASAARIPSRVRRNVSPVAWTPSEEKVAEEMSAASMTSKNRLSRARKLRAPSSRISTGRDPGHPREAGEVLSDHPHEFLRGLHDRHGRGKVRRGRQHPFRPPEAELEDPRMFKKPVRENGGEIPEIRGGRPSAALRDGSTLLAVREQCRLRRDLSRETDAEPRRAVDPRGKDRTEITRYSETGCDLPRPRQVPDGSQILVGRELEIRGRDDQEEEDGAQHGRAALSQSPALVRQHEGARHRPEREGKSQKSPGRHEHEERERDESAGRRSREGRSVDRAGPEA